MNAVVRIEQIWKYVPVCHYKIVLCQTQLPMEYEFVLTEAQQKQPTVFLSLLCFVFWFALFVTFVFCALACSYHRPGQMVNQTGTAYNTTPIHFYY